MERANGNAGIPNVILASILDLVLGLKDCW